MAQKKEVTEEGFVSDQEKKALAAGFAPKKDSGATKVDPFEQYPSFVPGKPGFEEGVTLAGTYQYTKRVYSDKLKAGKKDKDGKIYRDLHVLKHESGKCFNIWSSGMLGIVMAMLAPNQYIEVKYTGLAKTPLKPGQSAPHTFEFAGIDLHLDANKLQAGEDVTE